MALIRAYRTAVGWLERFPDTPAWFDRHLASAPRQFAALLLLGLVLRVATFGDPNLHVDEAFYFLVGQEMHRGAIPYVDIWDRKPIGLFLIYYAIAGISTSVIAYQIAAWLFASTTALVIALIARRWAGIQGGLLAGASYLFMLGPQEGYGGQSPVFYNLLIAGAALLVLGARPELERGRATWRVFLAMGLCGLALTVKQTTLFEAIFFGLVVAWYLFRGEAPRLRSAAVLAACALIGAAPTLASAGTYYWIGHWSEWWHAMVTSNLSKSRSALLDLGIRSLSLGLRTYPFIALSWASMRISDRNILGERDRAFLFGWIAFAILGVLSVPNFYAHYALPLLVPLAITSSPLLGRRETGVFLVSAIAVFTLSMYNFFDRQDHVQSARSMQNLAEAIRKHDSGRGLFIYDGPVYLYALAGKHPLIPLAFPPHLNHWIEKNVSQFDTFDQVVTVLKKKPGVVAMAPFPSTNPAYGNTKSAVEAYIQNNCQIVDIETAYGNDGRTLIAIWGDCREGPPDLIP